MHHITKKKLYIFTFFKVYFAMDLCLNSVRLETPNIKEIFFLNYSNHLGPQLWSEDRVQIAGGR